MKDAPKVIERRRSQMHGQTHYIVAGKEGAIDFHVMDSPFESGGKIGGVEFHMRTPPDYMDPSKPSHETCWAMLDKGPCWHDGTSLWASEYWIPMLDEMGEEYVFGELEREYRKRMGEGADE